MSGNRRKTDRMIFPWSFAIELAEQGQPAKPVQILKVGEFRHPAHGLVKITPDHLRAYKKSFDDHTRKIDLAIGYEHGESVAHGSKAAGWFRDVELREDDTELWAIPEWTPEGERAVREKEFRYTSAELLPEYQDPETGKVFKNVLKGASLTNVPYIKGMQAIEAHEETQETEGRSEMTLQEIEAGLTGLIGISLSELRTKAAAHDALSAQVVQLTESNKTLAERATKAEADVKKFSEAAVAAEKASAELKFKEVFEKGMRELKVVKTEEATLREMFEKMGVEFTEKHIAARPKFGQSEFQGHGNDAPETPDTKKSAAIQLSEKAAERATKDNISVGQAASLVLKENPELAKAYNAEADAALK